MPHRVPPVLRVSRAITTSRPAARSTKLDAHLRTHGPDPARRARANRRSLSRTFISRHSNGTRRYTCIYTKPRGRGRPGKAGLYTGHRSPLLGVPLGLLLHHAALLAVVELLVGLGDVEELEDALAAVYGRELAGRVPVDVQRPDVAAELHQEAHAELVAAGRRQVEGRVAEVVGFVRLAAATANGGGFYG